MGVLVSKNSAFNADRIDVINVEFDPEETQLYYLTVVMGGVAYRIDSGHVTQGDAYEELRRILEGKSVAWAVIS